MPEFYCMLKRVSIFLEFLTVFWIFYSIAKNGFYIVVPVFLPLGGVMAEPNAKPVKAIGVIASLFAAGPDNLRDTC